MAITTDFNQTDPMLHAVADMRNIIGEAHPAFDDERLKSFLRLANVPPDLAVGQTVPINYVKMATALALDTTGSSAALVQGVIETLELKTDGASLAKAFQAHAAALRKEVAQALELAQQTAQVASGAPRGRSIGSRRIDGYSDSCTSEHASNRPFCRWRG